MMSKEVKYLLVVLSLVLLGVVNYALLNQFNTLLWPYLWPRPGIFVLIGLCVAAIWLPQLFSGISALRIAGACMIFIGECYLIHSFQVMIEQFSLVAIIHFMGVGGAYIVMVISYINQVTPKSNKQAPPLPSDLPYIAAVIPTYGEPLDILTDTVISLKHLDYPSDRLLILVSDDGHRDEVYAMTLRQEVHYNRGAKKNAKAGNLNSALEYLDVHFPQATLILTQDADELIDPSFLKKTVGYFLNPQLAFVQTPKDAIAPPGDLFGVRDRVFYDSIQPGRNGANAAFSCGSGVLWRINAVKSIGGFATWNIVEDLTTSYFLHSAGYRSEYHNEILTIGLAPDDVPGLLKQRGTWAVDTWRLFLFNNPLTQPGLTARQRLQYMELGLFYTTSSFFMPLMMLTPLLSLITRQFLQIEGSALFPWLAISFFYYGILAQGEAEYLKLMWQYWVGHCPTYHKAFWIALRSRTKKPSYKVTLKTRQDGFYGSMLWVQFLYLFAGAGAIVYALFWLPEFGWAQRLTNIAILLFFMFMVSGICRAAFYNIPMPHKRILQYFSGLSIWKGPASMTHQTLQETTGGD
jgi:cellulose synthase (UDP-forming)